MELNEVKQYSTSPQNLPNYNFPPQQIVFSHSTPKFASSADFTAFSFNGLFLPDFPATSSISNSIPSFDVPDPRDPHHHGIPLEVAHDRRLKRMISNRESARRSRLRKKKQIEDLQGQVDHLRAANNQLSEKLITLLETNHQILQENTALKEKVSSLQVIVGDLLAPLRGVEDVSNRANYLKSEPSNHTR
ncbi:basic leucine zipper 43-like [Punica granatum]|uniref:BZIP domain-containing protein n=2 Tax=Punica granatum TaxID=22663 RepID=A0A218Y0M1_PUNGR|nr:basic leucine zipper 43-like [Punica granatum]OWM90341.1 hypothetical protein CDL15_Pgr014643 [Punica granatum]PKI70344.1 hypothetical protein CRG98_009224 [Punica granatum]